MTALLQSLSEFFTWCLYNMTQLFNYIVGNPALLILVVAMPICGFAFSLLHRLIRM